MSPARTPETLTAAQRAQRLNLNRPAHAANNGEGVVSPPVDMTKPPSKQQTKIEDQARKSLLSLSTTRPSATADLDPLSDADDSYATLPIDQIEVYAHNPRTSQNPRYEELKASIAINGITNMLTVSRRSPQDKYSPYGGGNTRLIIAKELYAAGDQRFATLKVLVKKWRGDADVISQHLQENELRGDITFFEKAQGVNQFRLELEKGGKVLSAGDLNKELKARGLNFGVRTIQNFQFAIEHLLPVGPWLKSAVLNEVIRPRMTLMLDLAAKLGIRVREGLSDVITAQGVSLRQLAQANAELEPHERSEVELNASEVLRNMEVAVAQVVDVDPDQLAAMLAALSADARISAADLRSAKHAPVVPASLPDVSPNSELRQPPQVAITRPPEAAQTPLPGMLAGVAPSAPPVLPQAVDSLEEAFGQITRHLTEINNQVQLHDVVMQTPSMPFGFWLELPAHIGSVDGEAVPNYSVALRSALWKFLAGLTYQFDRRVQRVITDKSVWGAAVQQGQGAFEQRCAQSGISVQVNAYSVGTGDMAIMFSNPDVAYNLIKLLTAMEQIRATFPERIPEGFEPLFGGDMR